MIIFRGGPVKRSPCKNPFTAPLPLLLLTLLSFLSPLPFLPLFPRLLLLHLRLLPHPLSSPLDGCRCDGSRQRGGIEMGAACQQGDAAMGATDRRCHYRGSTASGPTSRHALAPLISRRAAPWLLLQSHVVLHLGFFFSNNGELATAGSGGRPNPMTVTPRRANPSATAHRSSTTSPTTVAAGLGHSRSIGVEAQPGAMPRSACQVHRHQGKI